MVLDILPTALSTLLSGAVKSAAGAVKRCWEEWVVNWDEHNYCYCYICIEMTVDHTAEPSDERFTCGGGLGATVP